MFLQVEMKDSKRFCNFLLLFFRAGFRSESEQDGRSNTSYPYDDIDEMEEGRPLTKVDTDAASGDYMPMPDSVPDESAGKFWACFYL